jgi:YVTN family beta-propeller protein
MASVSPGSVFAGYRIEAVAGRGGMGVVYRARQLRPNRLVALKVIAPQLSGDPAFRRRFERESEAAASIEHPNVIPVYRVDEVDGLLFIAMRFVEGADLHAHIDDDLDPLAGVRILDQVASALDAAHAHGLVHRDVKPANVLVADVGGSQHAYLTDFGLTKRTEASSRLTRSGSFLGTVDYAAPEQIQGKRMDARTDVYALACVLFHVLTAQVPFPREDELAAIWAHIEEPPPPVPVHELGLPPTIEPVVRRGMAKDPGDRYPSAGELGAAARAAFGDRPWPARAPTIATGEAAPAPPGIGRVSQDLAPTARLSKTRRRLVALVTAGVLLLAAGISAVMLAGGDQPGERDRRPAAPPVTGTLVGEPINVPGGPRAIGAGAGSVWVATERSDTVTRIDAETGRVRGPRIEVGRGPVGVAVGEGAVWVANFLDGTVTRIDPSSHRVVGAPIEVGQTPADVAVGHGSVWTANWRDDSVSRIDPGTRRVRTIEVGDGPFDVATGPDAIWVVNAEGDSLSRVNPASNREAGSEIPVGERPESVIHGAGAVWVGNISQDAVTQVDPIDNQVLGSPIQVGERPDDLVVADGAVYVANQDADTIMRIDPDARKVVGKPLEVGDAPGSLAVSAGLLWVANFQAETIVRVRPGSR